MPSSALRELLKCWLPGGDEEISGNPLPWAPCMLGEARDGCEDAGGRLRGGKNMLLSGFRHLHHLVGHLGVCRGFCTCYRDKCRDCGAGWIDGCSPHAESRWTLQPRIMPTAQRLCGGRCSCSPPCLTIILYRLSLCSLLCGVFFLK